MGTKLKALAVVIGLMLLPLGQWPLSAILFLYATSGLFLRGLRRGRPKSVSGAATPQDQGAQAATAIGFKRGLAHPVRRISAVVFLGVSVVAFSQGGTFSPLLFGGVGVILLLWGMPLFRLGNFGSLQPVGESILLKRSLDPFHWFAVAEMKLATRHVGKALGGIDETLLVTIAEDGPSIFVVARTTSATLGGAEESLLARFRELARVSAPLGAYLLPVDSGAVAKLLPGSGEPTQLDSSGWPSSLSTTDYDQLVIEARRGGFVHAVGAYRKTDASKAEASSILPRASQELSRPSLVWEVFQELGKKVQWPKPDGYTTFLAGMFATEGEAIGGRVSEAGSSGSPQEVLVQSLGTPAVQVSRAQLRAIARIYS